MAEKNKVDNKNNKNIQMPIAPKKKTGSVFKILLIVMVLVLLGVVGFAAGIYLKFFDLQTIATRLNLQQYPVIGQYFAQPKTNFETVDLTDSSLPADPNALPSQVGVQPLPVNPAALPPIQKPDDTELQKLEKQKQQELAKKTSKLARLYGGMKPEEAVAILKEMDDNTVLAILGKMEEDQASKILALFDPSRAASLSNAMLKGKNTN